MTPRTTQRLKRAAWTAAAAARPKPTAPQLHRPGVADHEDVHRNFHRVLQRSGGAAYARRKAIVEPVFAQLHTGQDAKRLLLRGQEAAEAEWTLPVSQRAQAVHQPQPATRHRARTAASPLSRHLA
jgi:Transposase DDE domain